MYSTVKNSGRAFMTKRYILILLLAMISLVSAEEKKKVGFYFRHFTVRGTEVASYDYADCNETILGNESYIFYVPCLPLPASDFSQEVEEKFQKRFSGRFYQCSSIKEVDSIIQDKHIDVLYNIKSGEYDGVLSQHAKNAIHAVFTIAPHGDAYAAISDWVTSCHPKSNVPVVPHMVRIGKSTSTLHKELGIPENALVLGRHGGFTTFNIPFVKELITETAKKHPTYYFIFLHT